MHLSDFLRQLICVWEIENVHTSTQSASVTAAPAHNQALIKVNFLSKIASLFLGLIRIVRNYILLHRYGLLGFMRAMIDNPLDNSFYPVVKVPTTSGINVYITDPHIIQVILEHDRNEVGPDALFDSGITSQMAEKILGKNFFTSPSPEHMVFRTFAVGPLKSIIANPEFLQAVSSESDSLIKSWTNEQTTTSINIGNDLSIFAATIVARNLIGFKGNMQAIYKAMNFLLEYHELSDPTKDDDETYKNALILIESSAMEARDGDENKFLQQMSRAKKDSVSLFSNAEVLANAKILFFAGQDTTGSLLTYILYKLGCSDSSHWQETLYNQYLNIQDLPLSEIISKLPLLDAIIIESIRLHPPAYTQTRVAKQDLIINEKYFVPKNTIIYMLHYFALRNHKTWGASALEFNPSRHMQGDRVIPSQIVFDVFSRGPTSCLGKYFALTMIKIFLMSLLSKYHWETQTKEIHQEPRDTLYVKPNVLLTLYKRHLSTQASEKELQENLPRLAYKS